jgi:branched-chain amino acid transport system permease protein
MIGAGLSKRRHVGWGMAGLIAMVVIGTLLLFVVPATVELFMLVDFTVYAAMAILAMSLAYVWGYGGILSLGHSVFFGIGGYAYAIAALNFDGTTIPILLAIALPAVFAAMLGYFMFWGRVSDVYLAVITLTVSLIFFLVINSTSGGEYKIGKAAIGGYNGIPGLPPINMLGNPSRKLDFDEMYLFAVGLMLATYFGLRWLLSTRFGRITISIRENEARTELLGYDARKYKLATYVIGAGLAGIAGMLFAAWGALISPDVFGIAFAAQIIVWVMVGGLGTLVGPIVGAVAIQALVRWLGEAKITDANIILGAIFVFFVLFVPSGVVPKARQLFERRNQDQTATEQIAAASERDPA